MKKNLSFFQIRSFDELNKRKVVIFGASEGGKIVKDILLRNGVNNKKILFFCDNNLNLWGKEHDNKKVISPNELKEYCETNKEIIIIIGTVVKKFYLEIIDQIRRLNLKNTVILNEEIILLERTLFSIQNLDELQEIKNCRKILLDKETDILKYKFYEKLLYWNFDKRYEFIVMIIPAKTGSSTISKSLPYAYPIKKMHSICWMLTEDKINYKKYVKKMIIGVREAIAQNISLVYEIKSDFGVAKLGKQWSWINPQDVFDYYVVDSILNSVEKREKKDYGFEKEEGYPMLIQSWFEDELKSGLDINIFEYPFDKEAGYQIIKIDEYEILLYRLESMNSLEEVFEEFLNIKDFKLVRDNEANYKWYNESYQNFLENVTMPQEYIDISYNSKYMKHFYTEEEILKFREKWEKHVDPNWSIQGE